MRFARWPGSFFGTPAVLIRDRIFDRAGLAALTCCATFVTIGIVVRLDIALGATMPHFAYAIYLPVVSMISLVPYRSTA